MTNSRVEVRLHGLVHRGMWYGLAGPLGETVSIGVVQWDGEQTPEQLIGAADDARYRAKERERDRVVAALPPEPPVAVVRPGPGG